MPIANKLTADHFYKFFQCPHWIWYDIYADQAKRKTSAPLLDMIYRGRTFDTGEVLRVHKKFEEVQPELFRDLEEAFLATLELMKQGKNIYHGVLMDGEWVGMPDFLEARPLPLLRQAQGEQGQGKLGKSEFGAWQYVAYDVQRSLDLRDEYKFPLVFYSLILERLQGSRPEEAYVIDPSGNERSFLVGDYVDEFHLTRQEIVKILDGEKPPPFLKSSCKRTPWYSLCLADAQGCNDVSLIYRLSQSDQRRLYNIGIKTVTDLASADVNDLQKKLEEWPFDKIIRFNNQARALVENQPTILKKPDLPAVENEVYLDVESDPMRDTDYLLGVLTMNTKTGAAKYEYFMAKDQKDEKNMWQNFLDFLATLDDFVIYHYAFYEKQVFERLALRHGAPSVLVNKFNENTIDLHLKVLDTVIFPLYFYTLKDVAQYLGYKWNAPDAGGAESVVWYNQWLDTNDDAVRQKILKYNEDDVRATLLIKEWIEKQKPSKQREKLDE